MIFFNAQRAQSQRIATILFAVACAAAPIDSHAQTTAFHDGRFRIDAAGVVSRSNIVLAHANTDSTQAMPLGNGTLGVAIWSADGLTAQLNRADTMPERLSPGHVVIPGLAALTQASDYSGQLDLYNGEFQEKGGGMSATAWVDPSHDLLVIDVTGADQHHPQTALLKLWSPRTTKATAEGRAGILAQSWLDNTRPEASGHAFGTLAAITADAPDVSAAVTDPLTVTVSFKPHPDGHFRVLVACPHFDGSVDARTTATRALAAPPSANHRAWWHDFWQRAALIKITSADGAGEYLENLRHIYLYVAACEKGTDYPGSQAGVADLISAAQDAHRWDSSAFWHWNLRMQVAANIGAGLSELNQSYFSLYRNNLANIEAWTRKHMNGLPGVCVPETMRFDGRGIEYEGSWTPPAVGLNCAADFKPYYNARTISTGAEIALWVWEQYRTTGDRAFLIENYPLMTAAVRFLLAYAKPGADRLLHTSPANAHENQWDVLDPITDVSAMRALFPAYIEAATLLDRNQDQDHDLVAQVRAAIPKIPDFPRTQAAAPHTLLPTTADTANEDVLADSYNPEAEEHNIENLGLEPVWPYGLIGDASPLFDLALRTYDHRPSKTKVDWSYDPIQAARLHLGSEVRSTLIALTQKFQSFPNGMARWEAADKEFYVEQTGVVADALQEALVQDYDGVIRIAPALPSGWDVDGSVAIRNQSRVDVQTRNGQPTTVVIESGAAQKMCLRNPWPKEKVQITGGKTGKPIAAAEHNGNITFDAQAAESYLVSRKTTNASQSHFVAVSGEPASSPKKLGPVQIGIF